jgi:hypothetical protein
MGDIVTELSPVPYCIITAPLYSLSHVPESRVAAGSDRWRNQPRTSVHGQSENDLQRRTQQASRHRQAPVARDGANPETSQATPDSPCTDYHDAQDSVMADDDMPTLALDSYSDMADDSMPTLALVHDMAADETVPVEDATAVPDRNLKQMCLSIHGGVLRLSKVLPPAAVEHLVEDDTFDESAPEPRETAAQQEPACHTPIYELLGAYNDDGKRSHLKPWEHQIRTVPAPATAPDDHIPEIDFQVDLAPLDAFLSGAGIGGDETPTDLPATIGAPVCFGEDVDSDDDGNGWLGDRLEEHLDDTSVVELPVTDSNAEVSEGIDSPARPDPLDLKTSLWGSEEFEALLQFACMRHRGGQGSDSEGEEEQAPGAGVAPEPDVGQALTEPVWESDGRNECPLKVLQACQLIAQYKERHRITLPALKDLLQLLQALLPHSNKLPRSTYMFRNVSKRVLEQIFGGSTFRRLHMCSDPECTHMYTDQALRACPKCSKPRYHTQQNGKEKVIREMRYMGVKNGVKTLLMSKHVGRAIDTFDMSRALDTPHSLFGSRLSEHLCQHFIPGYAEMEQSERRNAKLRFFDTGQVCSEEEWLQYNKEVEEGTRLRTKLLVVEGGCDGFQPYRRRVWSTWMWGYRLTGVNWALGNMAEMEIVTAISEGATEGKAAHVVAALDANELKDLAPPSADERERGALGVLYYLTASCICSLLACHFARYLVGLIMNENQGQLITRLM